jgi:hypothetical protein
MVEGSGRGEDNKAASMEEENDRELLVLGNSGRDIEAEVGAMGRVQRDVSGENRSVGTGRRLRHKGARDGAVEVFDDLQEEAGIGWGGVVGAHLTLAAKERRQGQKRANQRSEGREGEAAGWGTETRSLLLTLL